MAIKDRIKILILSRYKSIRAFCISLDIPYSTFLDAMNSNFEKANLDIAMKVAKALDISTETLTDEEALIRLGIFTSDENVPPEQVEKNLKRKFLMDKISKADDETIAKLDKLMEIIDEEEWK